MPKSPVVTSSEASPGPNRGFNAQAGRFGYETGSWVAAGIMWWGDHLRFWHRPQPFEWPIVKADEKGGPIVMASLGGLGDLVLHLPLMAGFLQRMRNENRSAVVAVRPAWIPLLQTLDWPVLSWENPLVHLLQRGIDFRTVRQVSRQIWQARRQSTPLWIDLTSHVVNAFLLKSVRVNKLAGRINAGGASFIDHPLQRASYENEYSTVKTLAERLGLNLDFDVVSQLITRLIGPEVDTLPRPLVIVISAGPARAWPLHQVAELIDLLPSEIPIILVGKTSELSPHERTEVLPKFWAQPRIENRLDLLDPTEMVRLIARARAVVSPDGGLVHLALAAQVPTVALFGPTQASVWSPPMGDPRRNFLTILQNTSCPLYPCFYQRGCQRPDSWCMKEISANEVAKALRKAADI